MNFMFLEVAQIKHLLRIDIFTLWFFSLKILVALVNSATWFKFVLKLGFVDHLKISNNHLELCIDS